MPRVCRTCARVNPLEALYCYHDGAALDGQRALSGPLAIGSQPFPTPLVFPSGRIARTFDEFVLTCEGDWSEARELFRRGYLERFLVSVGRTDLALAARQAARAPDLDRGLFELLSHLPSGVCQPPRLVIEPVKINLGQVARQDERRVELQVHNSGMGLLIGSVACVDTPWLSLGDMSGVRQKLFQCRHEQSITIKVMGKLLRAGGPQLDGRIAVETNGGRGMIVLHAEVPARPFPHEPLTGARTPRQLAEKAKAALERSAAHFEGGAVAAWYEQNGWVYPVQGPHASGLAAVQQFFEALGLATPPKVEIDIQQWQLQGVAGQSLQCTLTVQTIEKRPVFAYAKSNVPWLLVGKTILKGRKAKIPLLVPTVPDQPGERLFGKVLVTANGQQRFSVEVALTVAAKVCSRPIPPAEYRGLSSRRAVLASARSEEAAVLAAVPILEVLPVTERVEDVVQVKQVRPAQAVAIQSVLPASPAGKSLRRGSQSGWLPLLPVALLTLGLFVPLGHDAIIFLRNWSGRATDNGGDHKVLRLALHFHDTELGVVLGSQGVKPINGPREKGASAVWEPTMRFGLIMIDDQPKSSGVHGPRRLTFESDGDSSPPGWACCSTARP